MKPGPAPKPRNLRLIQGDRKDRINDDEPIVEVSIPEPPEHLTDRQAAKFTEMAGKLARMQVMCDIDTDALAMYSVSWIRMLDADAKIAETGELLAAPRTGMPMQHPLMAVSNKARAECRAILCEFGMTPSSRTRVNKL